MKNLLNQNETWTGVSRGFDVNNPIPYRDERLQLVHEEAAKIYAYIKKEFYKHSFLIEVVLTLRQSNTDERLSRFLNEPGLIAPEFGKKFTGLYFQKVKIEMDVYNERKEYIETLRKFFESLVVKYFIENRTPYSNWEYSLRNPNPIKTFKGNQTAVIVNFPLFEFEARF